MALRVRLAARFWVWLAWRLPKPLAYWAAIRVGVHATQGRFSSQVVPDLAFMDALKRWSEDWNSPEDAVYDYL